MARHVAMEFTKELREVFLTHRAALDIKGAELMFRAELVPERELLRRALGKAMSACERRGIDTKQRLRASFPVVGALLEIWDMEPLQPIVIARLHETGWVLGALTDPNDLASDLG